MKNNILLLLFAIPVILIAQDIRLPKGKVTDNIAVNDSLAETFSLYLPTNFSTSRAWPVIFVLDLDGKGKRALSMFKVAAEEEGFVLASPNNINDTLTLSQNVLVARRVFKALVTMLPLRKNMTYTAGFSDGARFASILPTFIPEIKGVISCGAAIGNLEILSPKKPFYFIGIAGREDYNYTELLETRKFLNELRFPNTMHFTDAAHEWPKKEALVTAMRQLNLAAMAKGDIQKDTNFIKKAYESDFARANKMVTIGKPLLSAEILSDMIRTYRPFIDIDSLKSSRRQLKRSKIFKTQNRLQEKYFLQESFVKEDYGYYLEDDVITYNYNNLGWWNYQMTLLAKMEESAVLYENQLGKRLRGYLNALIDDNIAIVNADKVLDVQALNFLYMLRTITKPNDPEGYLKVISNSALMEDYGTALFYLEELLKSGYTDKTTLYDLEHTGLLRISPDFNEIVDKYLKAARYDIIEE